VNHLRNHRARRRRTVRGAWGRDELLSLKRAPRPRKRAARSGGGCRRGPDHHRPSATDASLLMLVEWPDGPVLAHSNDAALHRIPANRIENAVAFRPNGGEGAVCIREGDETLARGAANAGRREGTQSIVRRRRPERTGRTAGAKAGRAGLVRERLRKQHPWAGRV
jgi:hypothetical protein